MKFKRYCFVSQNESEDCGVACLTMTFRYLVGYISYQSIAKVCDVSHEGMSLKGLLSSARLLGLKAVAFYATNEYLYKAIHFPLIALVRGNHYVVIYSIYKKKKQLYVKVADPALGIIDYKLTSFQELWCRDNSKGVLVLMESTDQSLLHVEPTIHWIDSFNILNKYLSSNKNSLSYLFVAFFLILCIQLVLPFLTQNIVDRGINNNDINFVGLVLLAQMSLVVSKCLIEITRAQISLYVSSKISLNMISTYLHKLLGLSLKFFTKRKDGDLIQRMNDHSRIVSFLSTDTVSISIAIIGFIVSCCVLGYYSMLIFVVYMVSLCIYSGWTSLFLGIRKRLDYEYFDQRSKQTSSMIQLYEGMEEIKIQGCSKRKSDEFLDVYALGLKIGIRRLSVFQINSVGATLITQSRNIIITIMASMFVIKGKLTIGELLAIQYVIGQMESPIDQIINFIYKLQDLYISLNRISMIYEEEDEINKSTPYMVKESDNIRIENVSYRYSVNDANYVLCNLDCIIPKGKTTAIVGLSGSGKTTLLRLILGYDKPTSGRIFIGQRDLNEINLKEWRQVCGVVMQDGYVFADTIEDNIAISDDVRKIKEDDRLIEVATKACIDDIIQKMPLKYKTLIGRDGRGLSKGQKQRILISRLMYKSPKFVFLDEATNSLDSQTENTITQNLQNFFVGKTVLIIAHRMSTIKNADNIIVLENGTIVEEGKHNELMNKQGKYYKLVCNQVELT